MQRWLSQTLSRLRGGDPGGTETPPVVAGTEEVQYKRRPAPAHGSTAATPAKTSPQRPVQKQKRSPARGKHTNAVKSVRLLHHSPSRKASPKRAAVVRRRKQPSSRHDAAVQGPWWAPPASSARPGSMAPTDGTEEEGEERPTSKRERTRRAREAHRTGAYKKLVFPDTYMVDNPIVYQGDPRGRDTTDRRVVEHGQEAGFDTLGFNNQVGMQRDLFYYCPFLSCLNCNTIVFIDASRLRTSLNGDLIPHKVLVEALPTCSGCGRTDTYLVGADDLAELIKKNKDDIILKMRREKAAARVIQQGYRRSLYLRHGRAQRNAFQMYTLLQHRLAAIIQSLYRMRLAQRRLLVERDLHDIKKAHPLVFKWCLTVANQTAPVKCFWYHQDVMVRQLYDNYWILLERTGFRPKRYIVEENVHELARRVRSRIDWYASRIEKVWRGIMIRRYMGTYRRECTWVREQEVAAVFKSQRAFRGWLGRRHSWKLVDERKKEAVRKVVVLERERQVDQKAIRQRNLALMKDYVKERKHENTCRLLNRTDPKAFGGRKMLAYENSMYGGDEVRRGMDVCLDMLKLVEDKDAKREKERLARLEYVKARQDDNKYMHTYYDGEIRAGRTHFIEQLCKEVGYPKSFTTGVIGEFNARKAKYQFPEGINDNKRRILQLDLDEMYDDDNYPPDRTRRR